MTREDFSEYMKKHKKVSIWKKIARAVSDFLITTIGFVVFMGMLHVLIPSQTHVIHVGSEIGKVDTNLDKEIREQLLLLK